MQATGFFLFAIFVGILMLVVFSAAWFIAIPVAILLFLIPMAFVGALAARQQNRGAKPAGAGGMPSTGEASYDPVVDPEQRPLTR